MSAVIGRMLSMPEDLTNQILAFIEAHTEEQIRFLIDLCDQNSYTHNKEGTDRVAGMILSRLDGFFPDHRMVRQEALGDHHVLSTARGSGAVYLVGHMDTVFPLDHPFQRCVREGDTLRGPGTGDMKGGLAVIVYALLALQSAGIDKPIPLTLLLNADEEIGSPTSRSLYEEERRKAIACLVAECAGLKGELVASRNGKMGVRIESNGQDRHVGFGTHQKASAILELAHKIVGVEALNAAMPGVSVNVGKIEGGLGPCTIPAEAHCLVDVRWVDGAHQTILESRIKEIVSESVQKGCASRWEKINERPAMPLTDGTEALFAVVSQKARTMVLDVIKEHRRGTSDANFFGSVGVPTLDGWGPICDRDHTLEEHIFIPSLKERTALLALLLADFPRWEDALSKTGDPDR